MLRSSVYFKSIFNGSSTFYQILCICITFLVIYNFGLLFCLLVLRSGKSLMKMSLIRGQNKKTMLATLKSVARFDFKLTLRPFIFSELPLYIVKNNVGHYFYFRTIFVYRHRVHVTLKQSVFHK